MSIQPEQSWKEVFIDEFEKGYIKNLLSYIQNEQKEGRTIFPPNRFIFNAFNKCSITRSDRSSLAGISPASNKASKSFGFSLQR